MARAKRTDRAEARRRYRAAQQAAQASGEELEPADDGEEAGATRAGQAREPVRTPPRRASGTPPVVPPRPGIGYAFQAAFRPARFREDLAALPQLIRHRSVWLPALISIGTAAVLLVTGGRDVVSALVYQYFIVTPPIGAIFLSGFLAPRASYLTGAIAGLVGATCLAVLVAASASGSLGGLGVPAASPSPGAGSPAASAAASASVGASAAPSPSAATSPGGGSPAASGAASPAPSPAPTATGQPPTPEELADTVAFSFILSPLTGAFFGAAAAWYRRFLNLANPNRGARRSPPNRGKPRRR
ncbi:MAG TPA: hypothetical protein VGQ58_07685 [Candidatus Limnocylindrales bacterium]|nr:hypothetical protein [Candidatus Limnocylindrales bacterium]